MESSGEHRSWEDRIVDALRAPATWLFVLGLVLGAAAVHWGVERPPAEGALMVTVHNDSDVLIQAIHFDFGHDLSESSIREGQLQPGGTPAGGAEPYPRRRLQHGNPLRRRAGTGVLRQPRRGRLGTGNPGLPLGRRRPGQVFRCRPAPGRHRRMQRLGRALHRLGGGPRRQPQPAALARSWHCATREDGHPRGQYTQS